MPPDQSTTSTRRRPALGEELLLLDTTLHGAAHASPARFVCRGARRLVACQLCRHCPFGHFNVPDGKRPAEGSEGAAAITAPTLLRGCFSPRPRHASPHGPTSLAPSPTAHVNDRYHSEQVHH